MKNICRKLLAVALSAVMLCLSSTQMVFADTIEMKNNRIDLLREMLPIQQHILNII